jgi:Secretion system C-terminal sorting domain
MNKCKSYFFVAILLIQLRVYGQKEALRPLYYNPAYGVSTKNHSGHSLKSSRLKSAGSETLFFDDFSYNFADTIIYPDTSKWVDADVYINSSYCVNPISIGVATFDALDKNGKLYPQALTSQHFIADRLTSKPLPLGSYLPKDSLYFSFYYQAGGLGEPPDQADSLVLMFFEPLLQKWDTIWKVPGDSVKPFKRVDIPVTNPVYFQNGFQFRFYNFASMSLDNSVLGRNGNGNIWNLDYVQLIKGRSFDDTLLTDLAIDKPLYSPLRDFESIPWNHFILPNVYTIATQGGSLKLYVRNNDIVKRNTQRTYICEDLSNHSSFPLLSPSSTTLLPNIIDNFNDNLGNPLISDSKNSAIFKITAYIDSTAGEPRQNDTVVYYQVFKNYYAYDDGTAEWSYGLKGEGSASAMLAYKITGFKEDSLQAVSMHFNRSYNNENVKPFYLTVWSCGADGNPDQILYKKNKYFTNEDYYEPDTSAGFNYFHKYFLDTAILVPDTFFVGWTQMSETFLNVGFDINKNVGYDASDPSKNRIYYNFQGTPDAWLPSSQSGALMIRPLLGHYLPPDVGIKNLTTDLPMIYPNPATDWLNIKMPEKLTGSNTIVSIFDLTGKLEINSKLSGQSINVSSLRPGMYLIRLQTNTGQVFNSKVIIRPR